MEILKIDSKLGPAAIGPYSQGVKLQTNCFETIYLSGMLPVDSATGEIVGTTASEQAKQSLKNISAVLSDSGSSINSVVKTTVFIKNMADFASVNEVYKEAFKDAKILPARSCFEVSALPKNALVEIEVIATRILNSEKH